MKLFGSSKKAAVTTNPKESVNKIRENIEMLEKREKYMQQKIDAEVANARANAQKNKKVALMALKRKKMYEKQIEQMMATRSNLEQTLSMIESASINIESLNAMKAGKDVLKGINGQWTIDKVDDLMDDMAEQTQLHEQVVSALTAPMLGSEVDDDELMAELDELEQQELDAKLLEVPEPPASILNGAPKVPTTDPVRKVAAPVDDDEDELEQLRAQMAM